MGIFDEVFDALLTNDPGARSALRQTRALEEEVAVQREQIDALRREVTALQLSLARRGRVCMSCFQRGG